MKPYRVQSHGVLRAQMKAVARGAKRAPKQAAAPSFESVAALLRLLTPENRELLAVIRDKKPQSISELAQLTGRAQPNVIRTLGKLEAVGFVEMKSIKQRKVPTTAIRRFLVEVDPFSQRDQFKWA